MKDPRNKYDDVLKYDPKCDDAVMENYLSTIVNLQDTVVFLRLKNGDSFWYYIDHVNSNVLYGYVKTDKGWYYEPINIESVASYY